MDFDPNELVLSFQAPKFVPSFVKIGSKLRPRERGQTRRQTDRDDTGDLIICPMLCYSNGTDNDTLIGYYYLHVLLVKYPFIGNVKCES